MFADLTGKTALVTGGGSGIGKGIAEVLAAQGAAVAVADLNDAAAEAVVSGITDARALALHLDVGDPASVERMMPCLLSEWGALDILVNNAGIRSATGEPRALDLEEDWDATLNVNLRGTVRCCNAVVPHMRARRSGKIINVSSMAGHASRRIGGAYAVSKAAVLRYTKGLASDLAGDEINVNAICPGGVWTAFQESGERARAGVDASVPSAEVEKGFIERYKTVIPLGRPQSPEDIGKAAAFLASDDARNITGQCLHVDGGAILRD